MGKVNKGPLKKVFIRSQLNQFSHNYERMQSLGLSYAMAPAIDEIYAGRPLEEQQNAVNRHLEYFNTHPSAIPLIAGITIAMEEKTSEDEKDSVRGIKAGLMGPFAGLGDSLLNLTWYPIAGSIGASLSLATGSLVGPLVMFLMINLLYWPIKYYGFTLGYQKGIEMLESDGGMDIFDRVSNFANVLGVTVVGALIPGVVKVKTGIEFAAGEGAISLQESLDKVMPALLSVIVVYLCYLFLKKTNGKHTAGLILGVLALSILLAMAGILV
ncbi:PTS system mannose/fructose/sorbose family transporter subunit IID [Histophilus somni]|uniref:PTS system mannose/fructose/sorbose family transporter subunit IID n=1 Tax=Histophilus somni TaxID=731 RepID=UPI00201F18D1|nr:PTS system mannose/fructose/sorbose family transporter subunit IID [Histophilus somni]